MKKLFLTVILILVVTGCSSPETVALIAGAGSGATHTLLGINKDLEAALVARSTELREAIKSIDSAVTEAEKLAAKARAQAIEKQIEHLTDVQTGTTLVEGGLKTDWTNPQAVGGYSATVIAAIMAYLLRKKTKKYSAMKTGVNKFMANDDGKKSSELYSIIGEARVKNGV